MQKTALEKIALGSLAGLAATMAMTASMRRLHPYLDASEDYPLPPREIIDRTLPPTEESTARVNTLLGHFGYGALTGALYALLPARSVSGVAYGVGVWVLSYLGWIPAAQILAPAHRHPLPRNLLMILAHVVWGAALAKSMRELEQAGNEVFARSRGSHLLKPKERQEVQAD